MSTPPASRLEGPLHKLLTPQPDPSATLSTTLRDSYAIVTSPVTQGPKQRFSNRSAPWGIPQGDIVLVPLGLRNRRILAVGDRVARRMRRGGLLSYPLVP